MPNIAYITSGPPNGKPTYIIPASGKADRSLSSTANNPTLAGNGFLDLLAKDGILVSASCSMHLPEDDLQNILLTSARHLDRNIQMLERGGQGPDHPVHPAIAETRYIKSITCRLLPNS